MKVKLLAARLAFAALFEPKSVGSGADAKERFSAAFALDPKTPPMIESAPGKWAPSSWEDIIHTLAKAKYKDKWEGILKELYQKDRVAFRAGPLTKDGEVYQGFEGKWAINASNDAKPLILDNALDPETGRLRRLTVVDGRPYNGCYVNAVLDVWAQDHSNPQFGKRINASLKSVQFIRDGDAFGGGAPGTDADFEPIEAPTAEADDLM